MEVYLHRPYGRSTRGLRVRSKISGKRFRRISLLAAQVNGRLIAPMIYTQTMTSPFFEAWFVKELLPILDKKNVIILDNARFHRMSKLAILAQDKGHRLLALPPYSPDLNPIEKTWAHVKGYLRKALRKFQDFDAAFLSYFQV